MPDAQREGLNETLEVGFEFRKQRFVYNPQLNHVEKQKYPVKVRSEPRASAGLHPPPLAWPGPHPHAPPNDATLSSPPVQDTFEAYSKMTGHGTEQKALAAHDKYGLNKFEVPLPPFGELLKEHLMAPFFVFQVGR